MGGVMNQLMAGSVNNAHMAGKNFVHHQVLTTEEASTTTTIGFEGNSERKLQCHTVSVCVTIYLYLYISIYISQHITHNKIRG